MPSNGLISMSSFSLPNTKARLSVSFSPFNHRLKPKFHSVSIKLKPLRLGISQEVHTPTQHLFGLPAVSCLVDDEADVVPDLNDSSTSSDSSKEAVINIKLPRRSLLIEFTCNACGARSQKFINRLAYERGTVFVQCSGCLVHHKLADNLGLVVEYNFQEETNVEPDTDQL